MSRKGVDFFALANHPSREWTRRRLREVFVPADQSWRLRSVAQGLDLVEQAIAVF